MEPNSKRQQSEFNMAVSYLNRLNTIFYMCDQASIDLNAHDWFMALMALKRELSTEMKPDEKKWFDTKSKDINIMVQANSKNMRAYGAMQIGSKLYECLDDFETRLRSILEDSGLQKKRADDFLEPEED